MRRVSSWYDGLGRRVKRIVDTDSDGTAEVNGDDFVQREYYTNAWQRVEVRPKGSTSSDSSTNGMCLYVYGVRYVDDMVHRRRDTDDSGAVDEQFYSLSDANYNVVTVVNEEGEGIERVYYSAYGVPECFPFGDADYDYTVEASDANVGGGYSILKDINLDGAANQADADLGAAYLGYIGGLGELTSVDGGAGPFFGAKGSSPDNRKREALEIQDERFVAGNRQYQVDILNAKQSGWANRPYSWF